MLLAKNALSILLASYYLWQAPVDVSQTGASVEVGLALVVLIMIARCTSATTIREL